MRPAQFRETPGVMTLATDGYCQWALNSTNMGPVAGNNAWYMAYMDKTGGCNNPSAGFNAGAHNIKVAKIWDFVTGTSDAFTTIASINPNSDDAHEAPQIHRLADGRIYVQYGAISASVGGTLNSPFYRISSSPDQATTFDPVQRVPSLAGYMTENTGGVLSDGTLHMIGAGGNQNVQYNSFNPSTGAWTITQGFIRDGGGTVGIPPGGNGFQGDPVGMNRCYAVPGTTTLFFMWGRDFTAGAGDFKDIFLIKSTNGGATWTAIDGTNSFSRASGILGIFDSTQNLYDYPAAYKIHSGDVRQAAAMTVLSNGRPVIAYRDNGGLKVKRYNGSGSGTSAFTTTTVNASVTGQQGVAIVCTSTDKLLVYGSTGNAGTGDVKEFISTDGGVTWPTTNTIWTKTASETANIWFHARCFPNIGGRERVGLVWIQTFTITDPTNLSQKTHVMFADRPQ